MESHSIPNPINASRSFDWVIENLQVPELAVTEIFELHEGWLCYKRHRHEK